MPRKESENPVCWALTVHLSKQDLSELETQAIRKGIPKSILARLAIRFMLARAKNEGTQNDPATF